MMNSLPEHLRRSLNWERGKDLAQHAQFKVVPPLTRGLLRPCRAGKTRGGGLAETVGALPAD